MSFITEEYKGIPTGFRKILYFHWPLAITNCSQLHWFFNAIFCFWRKL